MKKEKVDHTHICRCCGKRFVYKNPPGTKRKGGRQAVYCSDECRERWRKRYKRKWEQSGKRERSRRLQREGKECCIVDFKRDRELEQLVMELELYPDMLKHLVFDFDFRHLGYTVDEQRVNECLDMVERLELSTEYLENTQSWYLEEIGVDL